MKTNTQMIYIHIPFCTRKCFYCGFVSVQNKSLWKKYFEKLYKEIEERKNDVPVSSIYFGGGTPSIVDFEFLKNALKIVKDNYKVEKNAEITLEANPTLEFSKIVKDYKEIGFNRISFGVQSLSEDRIVKLGRIQPKNDVIQCIKNTLNYFDNISADLLIGLQEQNENDIINDIALLHQVGVKHLSVYMLMIEQNTKLFELVNKNEYRPSTEEESVFLYECAYKQLKNLGYERYEISNFCQKGYHSRHNLGYWQMKNYLGFGAAAHSFENPKRYFNSENINEYITNNKIELEILSNNELEEEAIMLGLRTSIGVNEKFIKNITELEKLLKLGYIRRNDENIVINENYFNIANQIILKLI